MHFKKSAIDYRTKKYYPYIVLPINLGKEKTFYLKTAYIYKNMFMHSSSKFRNKPDLLYFSFSINA